MNEIIRELIIWTEKNHIMPEILFYSELGGIWLRIKLRRKGKTIQREFYFAGGVLSIENWDLFNNSESLEQFIEEAKKDLGT